MLVKRSMFQFDAATAVQRMLEADLYGIPAHGCGRIGEYLDALDVGDIDPRARVLTLQDAPAFAVLDGSRAMGQVAATKGAELAAEKAAENGIAMVTIGNSQTLGAAAVYVRLIAERGLIGLCLSSTGGATVTAPGTTAGAVGNSPLAYAVPVQGSHPVVFDAACGMHSWGKLELLGRYGIPFPEGIAFDAQGAETNILDTARTMHPTGGAFGFGLSLLCSILAGPLAGGRTPIHKKRSPSAEDSQHVFLAIDIAQFTNPETFQKELQATLEEIRNLPPIDALNPVRIPGDRQMACFREYSETGIPIHRGIAEEIKQRAEKLKVEVSW
jgi:LDH2 family malate/lactate/ureidoglycolate dehydrogenase